MCHKGVIYKSPLSVVRDFRECPTGVGPCYAVIDHTQLPRHYVRVSVFDLRGMTDMFVVFLGTVMIFSAHLHNMQTGGMSITGDARRA